MILRRILQSSAALGLVAALSACSILKTPPPVQMYRFGAPLEAAPEASDAGAPVSVALRRVDFPAASGDDRILGMTGAEAAYIGGARWVSPASSLFEDSLRAAFGQRSDRIRLQGQREPGASPVILQVSVTSFEARYDAPGATPDVVITARAQLRLYASERRAGERPAPPRVIEHVFTVTRPAEENRVAAIVTAFDAATRDLNARIVDWTVQSTM